MCIYNIVMFHIWYKDKADLVIFVLIFLRVFNENVKKCIWENYELMGKLMLFIDFKDV